MGPVLRNIKQNSIELIDLNFKYLKICLNEAFLEEEILIYDNFFIIIFSFNFLLKKNSQINYSSFNKSLPLTLLNLFKFKTDFILRISGYPKLNILRKFFWRASSKKLKIVTCPTLDLKRDLENLNLFKQDNLHYLPDAIIKIDNLRKKNIPDNLT